jgi:Na+/melibiose symporter-like transporter
MIRRVLLVVMVVIVSLSLAARFMISPVIAIFTGLLVGLLSKDNPISTSVLGLAPWIFNLFGPDKPSRAWLGLGVVYIALGATAALFAFRFHKRDESAEMASLNSRSQ